MARIYANENFPLPAVVELRRLGHDVLTTLDAGKSGQAISDDEVLEYARQQNRVVLTLNRKHFIRLHNLSSDHTGIIVCTVDPDYVALASRVDDAIQHTPDIVGQLLRVNRAQN